jgi:hypothetical protein
MNQSDCTNEAVFAEWFGIRVSFDHYSTDEVAAKTSPIIMSPYVALTVCYPVSLQGPR